MANYRWLGLRAALLVGVTWGLAVPNEAVAQQTCMPNYTLSQNSSNALNLINEVCGTVSIPQGISLSSNVFISGSVIQTIDVAGAIISSASPGILTVPNFSGVIGTIGHLQKPFVGPPMRLAEG